ncbi:hypothetical protein FQR65_LT19795, partial [Abscondita terminalis]
MDGINKFDQYAEQIFEVNLQQKYNNLKMYSMSATGASLILISFSICSTVLINIGFESYAGHLTHITIPKMISTLILLPFLVLSLCLRQRFVWINKAIDKKRRLLSKAITENVDSSFLYNEILTFVEMVRDKHANLCSMCKNLNKAYHVQFLSIMLKSVISITIGVFYGGATILHGRFEFGFLFFPLTEALVSAIQTLVLTLVCSETIIQAERSAELIHTLSSTNNGSGYRGFKKKINLEIVFFSLQMLHNKVEFTALHMFPIKEKMLVS